MSSDAQSAIAREFVLFCFERRRAGWPFLYDEMCFVAGHRLFRQMGYDELREAGIEFGLGGLNHTSRLVQEVIGKPRDQGALGRPREAVAT